MKVRSQKLCPRCAEYRPATTEWFWPSRSRSDGLGGYCRPCEREKGREQKRKSRAANPGKNAEACRRYRNANPARARERNSKWYAENAERARAMKRAEIAANPQAHRARVRRWRADNPKVAKETALRSYSKRRQRPEVRINDSVRRSVAKSLSKSGTGKNGKRTEEILGYGKEELKAHLGRQFTKGMGWHNYGEWHVDHIVPLSAFTFTSVDDAEFKAAWALANLRPMWGLENMSKSGKRIALL